jgi:5-formyltetrahydrofolate cyclo-ligase
MMRHAAGEVAAARFSARALKLIEGLPGQTVSGYIPVRHEMDVSPLMEALAKAGKALALPVVSEAGAPLIFRQYTPGGALIPGAFSIPVPPASSPLVTPDILIVPLAAFDRAGHRLGYGGGFYDRTLAALRAQGQGDVTAIGAAFHGQELDAIPREKTDQPLDWIVTDRETIRATG